MKYPYQFQQLYSLAGHKSIKIFKLGVECNFFCKFCNEQKRKNLKFLEAHKYSRNAPDLGVWQEVYE